MFLDTDPYILPKDKKLVSSTLWHWAIRSENLFVEGAELLASLTGRKQAGPLFLQFRHPKLMDYNGEVLLKLPDDYESLDEGNEKARIRNQAERSIVL